MVDHRDVREASLLGPVHAVNLLGSGDHTKVVEYVRKLDVQDFFAMASVRHYGRESGQGVD
jgi:hypothetical protein